MKLTKLIPASVVATLLPLVAFAQDAEVAAPGFDEIGPYIMTTLLFLIGGFLVMWMAAGFAMLEAGLVRSKNVTTQLLKNVVLFSIAAVMYWLIGYSLMYPGDAWIIPGFLGAVGTATMEPVGLAVADADLGYASVASDFFFQLMFCATTASIVSGTLAERIKIWPFFIFVVVLTGFFYPIEASWQWGGGFLSEMGFSDFAGSTLVHSAGGWAALAGALVLGPRIGKYKDGKVTAFPGSNLALATLGTFILWLGWFGFNGGSQLAAGTIGDITDVGRIFVNTNMAAAAGSIAALILTQIIYGKIDLTMVLNGALAGLVSITAEPLAPSLFMSLIIGGIGGIIVVFAVPFLDKLKIDDVVGAIPVHLLCGIWGTIAVPLTNADTSFGTQLVGIVSIGAFTFVVSLVLWLVLKAFGGIRVSEESEITGLDKAELGMEAYPEFYKG
ncbi:ammonium transporter (TC 1.A.11) [Celeribacter baekdonensis]|uniref:Ammonium transporter n=1 Tax=Celeribacter baekdonensis TaxID=875171 RepID=A0A1G7N7Q9_9RHOB|nr:ammonium transporter [Celeribacter baekdonensis]SDF69389.1 ammonium transporter (TC 1.A.11) [Celeribacter baekdonensis]